MRLSQVVSFISIIICLNIFNSAFGNNEKTANKRGEKQAFTRSGKFSTKFQHECTWEITGDQKISLIMICNEQGNNSYRCTYEGEPQRCPLYSTKAKQYWKQILGKFKKARNVCEEKTLKARICKKAEAVESQLRKVAEDGGEEIELVKTKGKTHMKEPGKDKGERPKSPEGNVNLDAEQKDNSKKKKPSTKSKHKPTPSISTAVPEVPTTARVVNDDFVELNEDLAETYCTEKWHSLCSFFVNFWNG